MAKWYIVEGIRKGRPQLATEACMEMYKHKRKVLYDFEAEGLREAHKIKMEWIDKHEQRKCYNLSGEKKTRVRKLDK